MYTVCEAEQSEFTEFTITFRHLAVTAAQTKKKQPFLDKEYVHSEQLLSLLQKPGITTIEQGERGKLLSILESQTLIRKCFSCKGHKVSA